MSRAIRVKPSPVQMIPSILINYTIATRPWSFTTSCIPMILTAVLLYHRDIDSFISKFLRAFVSILFLHAGSNLVNTYCDFTHGRDTKKDSGDRALVDNKVSKKPVLYLAVTLYVLSAYIIFSSFPHLHNLLFTTFSIGAALSFFYSASSFNLKSLALGDMVIFLCFGPLLMNFISLILTEDSLFQSSYVALYTIPFGLLTEGILHANNTRDIEMDRKGGVLTMARVLGFRNSRLAFIAMVLLSYISSLMLSYLHVWGNALVLLTVPLALGVIKRFQPKTMDLLPEQIAQLHFLYGSLTIVGILLSSRYPLTSK